MNLSAFRGFEKKGLLEKTSRFKEVYGVKKEIGSKEENYYYKFDQAFFKVELWETKDNSEDDSTEREILNMESWLVKHPKAELLKLELTSIEWQSDEEI